MVDVGATISLVAALGGLIAGVAALIRVVIDRRHGIDGAELKADEMDLNRLRSTFEIQSSLIENYRNDNLELRKRVESLEKWKREQEKLIFQLQRELRVRINREEILISFIGSRGEQLPPLPTLPNAEDN